MPKLKTYLWDHTARYNLWQHFIRFLARRVPPTHKRVFPAVFGTFCFFFAWLIVPTLVDVALANPKIAEFIARVHAGRTIHVCYYLLIISGTLIGIAHWARVIQLCWPDYFNAHDDRHT